MYTHKIVSQRRSSLKKIDFTQTVDTVGRTQVEGSFLFGVNDCARH